MFLFLGDLGLVLRSILSPQGRDQVRYHLKHLSRHWASYYFPWERLGASHVSLQGCIPPLCSDVLCEHSLCYSWAHFCNLYVRLDHFGHPSFYLPRPSYAWPTEIQALTRSKLFVIPVTLFNEAHPLPVYISLVAFTKLAWVLATYFSYTFFPSTH